MLAISMINKKDGDYLLASWNSFQKKKEKRKKNGAPQEGFNKSVLVLISTNSHLSPLPPSRRMLAMLDSHKMLAMLDSNKILAMLNSNKMLATCFDRMFGFETLNSPW